LPGEVGIVVEAFLTGSVAVLPDDLVEAREVVAAACDVVVRKLLNGEVGNVGAVLDRVARAVSSVRVVPDVPTYVWA